MSTASRSTLALSLVTAAVVGFGGGALIATAGGDGSDPRDVTTGPTAGAGTQAPTTPAETSEPATAITLQSTVTSSPPGVEIPFSGTLTPGAGGITLTVQRNNGDGWNNFGTSPVTTTTRDDGSFTTSIITRQAGAAEFRVIGQVDGAEVASNAVPITIG